MKKVFAVLSTLLLTIAFVGIFSANEPALAAEYGWDGDTTLAEDEIPVYIMNSVYTTFPDYYDNAANPDPNYQEGRKYAWNETRIRIAQLNPDGTPTGSYYAIYLSAHVDSNHSANAGQNQAGKSIYVWAKNATSGEVELGKYDKGKYTATTSISSPSLSWARYNVTGEDIEVTPESNDTLFVKSVVFNGQGQVVRGITDGKVYDLNTEYEIKFTPEYCFVDGVATKYEDASQCDVELEPKTDADGNYVDANGNKVDNAEDAAMEEKTQFIDERFVWEFFEEKPENVNTVPYLSEGWDYNLWDYCYEVEGGWMAIAFVDASWSNKLSTTGKENIAAQLMAADPELDESAAMTQATNYTRECTSTLRVSEGGFMYVLRGLDDTSYVPTSPALKALSETVIYGYKYGRQLLTKYDNDGNVVVDEEGNEVKVGLAEPKTYIFGAGALKFTDKVIDNQSYQLLNGQNIVEVMQGNKFASAQSINYSAIQQYWARQDDVTSFSSSADALEFYISIGANGADKQTVVQPTAYPTFESMRDDYLKDYNAWIANKQGYKLNAETGQYEKDGVAYVPLTVGEPFSTGMTFYTTSQNYLGGGSANANFFTQDAAMVEKWNWLYEYIKNTMAENGIAAATCNYVPLNGGTTGSIGTFISIFYNFLNQSYKSGWPSSQLDWSKPELTNGWIDTVPSLEKWNAFELDASNKAPGDYWTVTYKVSNTDTGTASEYTVKYVVVDSYTPIIRVADFEKFNPSFAGDIKVIDAIDPYSLVSAYDAKYNGVSILGNDISQYIEFETELDWEKPTEGVHPVKATIWNNSRTKYASVEFNVEVADVTDPLLKVRPMTINQGEDFDFRQAIIYAYDAVDGDLTSQVYDWYLVDSVDTSKPGTYNVKLSVFDRTDNDTPAVIKLTVVAAADYNDEIGALGEQVGALDAALEDVKAQVADLALENAELQQALSNLANDVNSVASSAEEANNGSVVIAFGIINAVIAAVAAGVAVYAVFFKNKEAK